MAASDEPTDAGTQAPSSQPPSDDETLASGPRRHASLDLERGTLVGRYVVLHRLGAGAMGVVLAAYDPQLDRKVALKLLKPHDGRRSVARARLQREAQALARLNHTNVVAVHDVGVHEDQTFVAMEFVEGTTLGRWMRDAEGRSWRAVLAVFEAAGRGLAAAHAAGLIHRDFKPENVMLGDDGRVRVMDFGLARSPGDDEPSKDDRHEEADAPMPSAASLTRTGAVVGTPAYMSPEQFMGSPATAHSDQFSFCVALFEALYGVRPFVGDTAAELAHSVTTGGIRGDGSSVRIPGWLRDVVVRGLSVSPEERFPTMAALLAALETTERRRRRRRWTLGATTVAVGLAAVIGLQRYDRAQRVRDCEASGATIDEVWNPSIRDELHQALLDTGAGHAADTAQRVTTTLDAYASTWRQHRVDACRHTTLDETWSTDRFDRAQWCLDDRRLGLGALVDKMRTADDHIVHRATLAASNLPSLIPCMNEIALAGMGSPPPEDLRPSIAEIRATLSEARSLSLAGKYEDGLALVRDARARAETTGWEPLRAAALQLEATLLKDLASFPEAESTGIDAFMIAAKSGTWSVAAAAASSLIGVVGYRGARHQDAKLWARHAEVSIAHASDPTGLREVARLNQLGNSHHAAKEYEVALHLYERALARSREVLGPRHYAIASGLNDIGAALFERGDYEGAKARLEEALAIGEEALGPEHPEILVTLNNLGATYSRLGNAPEAMRSLERALELQLQVRGPDHPEVATCLNNLAELHGARDDFDQAEALLERALAIWERSLGSRSLEVALALHALGRVSIGRGEPQRVKELTERSLAIRADILGPDHPSALHSLTNVGLASEQLGDYAGARTYLERALAVRIVEVGPDDPRIITQLRHLGDFLYRGGEYAAALEYLERAVSLESAEVTHSARIAQSLFALARALWDAPELDGRDRPRARRLAERARTMHDEGSTEFEAIEEWLSAHPLPTP